MSPMTHEIEIRSRIRMPIASPSPIDRPFACCSGGSLPVRIEMKMMLSMPRTISSVVSVARATQALGSEIQSNMRGRERGPGI